MIFSVSSGASYSPPSSRISACGTEEATTRRGAVEALAGPMLNAKAPDRKNDELMQARHTLVKISLRLEARLRIVK